MRILIVEDDPIAAYLTENLLKGFGYEVIGVVTTGEEAILKSRALQPDIILMDISLGGVYNGLEAAQIIGNEQDIPIIYLTAADTVFFENVVKTTSYGYLSKPVDTLNLKLTIEIARHKFQYEKRLKESEELYRLLSENSKDLICLHGLDGTFLYLSNAVKELLGYEPEELIGRNACEFLFEEEVVQFSQALGGEHTLNDEKRLWQRCVQHKDGRRIWIETLAKTIFDKHGKAIKLQTSSRDITDRKLAEEKLKLVSRENSKLAIVTSNTNNAIIITDPAGYIEWTNIGFTQFSGYTLEEVKGKKPGEILQGPKTNSATIAFMREELKHQRGFKTEVLNYTRSGKAYWVDMEVQPLFDEEGKLINFLGLQLNITERKAYEAALKKSKEEAEIANKAKSDFLSNMSHEIRTPLNAIMWITEILLEEKLEPHILENIRTAKYSADNLLRIVNGILDLSKVESGKFTFEALEFSLSDMIDNLYKVVQTKVADKQISIHFNISPDIPTILIGDPFRLNQILLNLLSNAIKFTQEGMIELSIYPVLHRREQIVLLFKVRDTGIGIDADKISDIFESFSQADTSTTRQFGGTGLGLSITKSLVELQGGSIWVESKHTKGSTFYFELPFVVSDKKALMPDITPSPQGNSLEGISILLVEDNVINRTLNEQLFKKWKVTYHCAEDGLQAIHVLKKQRFDIILMDVQMPNMDGYEASRIIRDPQSEVLDHKVPIIALTANAFAHSKQLAIEAGMNDFISKPFKQEQLLQAILQCIGQKDSATSSTALLKPQQKENDDYQWIDLSIIKDIVEDDHEALILVLQEFADSAHLEVARLQQAYAQKEMQKVADVAHKLRSAFRYLGKNQAEKQIHQLEILAREGKDVVGLSALIDEVVFCYNATLDEVKVVLNGLIAE